MRRRACVLALLAGMLPSIGGLPGIAADRVILGGKLAVKDPGGVEERRSVVGVGKERATDVPVLSDPTAGGAVLSVAIDGATSTVQSYVLDATGWRASGGTGYRYVGPTATDGDPVRKVMLQRRANGTALLKMTLRGGTGTQSLDLVPPNPGVQGAFVLSVAGGDRYCVTLGGGAGGSIGTDTSRAWKVRDAVAEVGCPTTTSTTLPAVCGDGVVEQPEECEPVVPGACPQLPDVACGAAGGPAACRCCVVPGGAIEFVVGQPICCDGSPCDLSTPFVCQCPP